MLFYMIDTLLIKIFENPIKHRLIIRSGHLLIKDTKIFLLNYF